MQINRHRIRAWARVGNVVALLAFASPAGAQADAGYSPHAGRSIPDRLFFDGIVDLELMV